MKCLDKKRIKMKGGETLALNERIMLSLVSTGVSIYINIEVLYSQKKDEVDIDFEFRLDILVVESVNHKVEGS